MGSATGPPGWGPPTIIISAAPLPSQTGGIPAPPPRSVPFLPHPSHAKTPPCPSPAASARPRHRVESRRSVRSASHIPVGGGHPFRPGEATTPRVLFRKTGPLASPLPGGTPHPPPSGFAPGRPQFPLESRRRGSSFFHDFSWGVGPPPPPGGVGFLPGPVCRTPTPGCPGLFSGRGAHGGRRCFGYDLKLCWHGTLRRSQINKTGK